MLLLLSVAFYTVFLRRMYYRPGALERSAVGAAWTTTGFSVAVVWPPHTDASLIQGVQLAWEETNAAGGLLANKIRLRFFTETDDAGALARDIARVRDVVAVIGHEIADNVIPASLTYEQHGILFLSPKSTNRRLTTHGFTYTFRLTDDDGIMTSDMAVFAAEQNWKRIGILYGQNEHGVAASGLFLTRARADGIDVPFYESYLGDRQARLDRSLEHREGRGEQPVRCQLGRSRFEGTGVHRVQAEVSRALRRGSRIRIGAGLRIVQAVRERVREVEQRRSDRRGDDDPHQHVARALRRLRVHRIGRRHRP